MSYQMETNSLNILNEDEEERIIREYEQECANEDVIDIKKLNLNCDKKYRKSIHKNDKFDKCLNISDDEYLQTINQLDAIDQSNRSIKFLNTSIPIYILDNLNKNEQRKLNQLKSTNLIDNLDNYFNHHSILDLSNNSINLNNQSNDLLNNNFINFLSNKSTTSNTSTILLKQSSSSSICSSNTDVSNTDVSNTDVSNNDVSNTDVSNNDVSFNLKNKKSIITFELINAKSVLSNINNSTKRFIVYTIVIKRSGRLETKPGIIEKRYSDFHRFYLQLRKYFPLLFEQFPFPKKIYSNNFEVDVIYERSIVFQHLMTYCLSIRELRISTAFYEFILQSEIKKCRRLLRTKQFEESIICLENLNFILIKLNQIESSNYLRTNIFITYIAISACYNQIEQYEDAANYADCAFKMILFNNEFDNHHLMVPFLLLSVQLNSRLSKDCKAQNDKLLELSDKNILFDKSNYTDNLIDLFVLKNYFLFNP